jgi:hypothetical protein
LASERQLSDDIVRPLRAHYRDRLKNVEHQGDGERGRRKFAELNDEIEFQLIEAERLAINDRYRRGQLKDEARRRVERELDLSDARLTTCGGMSASACCTSMSANRMQPVPRRDAGAGEQRRAAL